MMMINRVVIVIGLLYLWDKSIGEVENYFIWKEIIEADHGFVYLDFTETPL